MRRYNKYKILFAICIFAVLVMLVLLFIFFYPRKLVRIWKETPDGIPEVYVSRERNGYVGRFPDVAATEDGLVAVYYWNKKEIHAPWYYGDPMGEIMISNGSSDARKWSEGEPFITKDFIIENELGIWADSEGNLYYDKNEALDNNAQFVVDVRDPNLTMTDKGYLIFTFFTWIPKASKVNGNSIYGMDDGFDFTCGKVYLMVSADNGKTWDDPMEIPCEYLDQGYAKRGDIAVYDDGTILIPLYGYNSEMLKTKQFFTTANIYAKILDGGSVIYLDEYSTHTYENEQMGAFSIDDSEVSFGVTQKGVTYAFCRKSGNVLISENKGQSWELIAVNNSDTEERADTMQPSFCRIPGLGTNYFFVSWSEYDEAGRSVFAKFYDYTKPWNSMEKFTVYKNTGGSWDMADPSQVYIGNNTIFTIFYDVDEGCIGGVFTEFERGIFYGKN